MERFIVIKFLDYQDQATGKISTAWPVKAPAEGMVTLDAPSSWAVHNEVAGGQSTQTPDSRLDPHSPQTKAETDYELDENNRYTKTPTDYELDGINSSGHASTDYELDENNRYTKTPTDYELDEHNQYLDAGMATTVWEADHLGSGRYTPGWDPRFGLVYVYQTYGFWAEFDRDGHLLTQGELPIEQPFLDPVDFWDLPVGVAKLVVVKGGSLVLGAVAAGIFKLEARTILEKGIAWEAGKIQHHIFPLEMAEKFLKKGIDPHDWTVTISDGIHHQLHAKSFEDAAGRVWTTGPGGAWNESWRQFFTQPRTHEEILVEGERLVKAWGLPTDMSRYRFAR
jgi:hypothetical protein